MSPFAGWKPPKKHEAESHDQRDRGLAGEDNGRDFSRKSALEEKAHARALNVMAPLPDPRTLLDRILKRERWQGRGGSWGLTRSTASSPASRGATNNQQPTSPSDLPGMLASSLSMGAGAYLATRSEAEVYEAKIAREKREVEENPEEEISCGGAPFIRLGHHVAITADEKFGSLMIDKNWQSTSHRARRLNLKLQAVCNENPVNINPQECQTYGIH
jgi:hypothetical protein